MIFANRQEAGRRLADLLADFRDQNAVVLGIPRGGLIVASEVAKVVGCPLSAIFAKKVAAPWQPEYALAAVEAGGAFVASDMAGMTQTVAALRRRAEDVVLACQAQQADYLGPSGPVDLRDRTAILIDDGLATGLTMMAAVEGARRRQAAKVVVGIPVGPRPVLSELRRLADWVATVEEPASFTGSVGSYYFDFSAVTDEEARAALLAAHPAG